jgi:hypothetical protein
MFNINFRIKEATHAAQQVSRRGWQIRCHRLFQLIALAGLNEKLRKRLKGAAWTRIGRRERT